MSVFEDQRLFMNVSGQKSGSGGANLYRDLITEEFIELQEAWGKYKNDRASCAHVAEVADACMDMIYVISGLMHSMGLDPQAFWDEVQRSNMSKFSQLADGSYSVTRRDDGKILKPATYSPPNLTSIVLQQWSGSHVCVEV